MLSNFKITIFNKEKPNIGLTKNLFTMKKWITVSPLLTFLFLMVTPLLAIVRVDNVPNNTITSEIQLENFSV